MNLNEYAQKIHQNAVAHGWWDEERSFGDIVALCHSELSEALEEYRAGRAMEWSVPIVVSENPLEFEAKPEGIAVEMADCLIRILDYAGKCGWDCDIEEIEFIKADGIGVPECVAELHGDLSMAWFAFYMCDHSPKFKMFRCAGKIITWLTRNYGTNWIDVVQRKHEYNKTRPYRHGNKKL